MHSRLLTPDEVAALGLAACGADIRISRKASFYGAGRISLGDHVRIDDFCVLSAGAGGIQIGSFIHLGVGATLIGAGRITLADFCNFSSRVAVYSSNDDYSGRTLTGPMVPPALSDMTHADVHVGKHVIVGCGSVVLPGVSIGDGAAIGALSLVNSSCAPFGIYAGTPARYIKERDRGLLALEKRLDEEGE